MWPLKQIVILSDGIPGHVSQSRGIAAWLSRLTEAPVHEAAVPALGAVDKRRLRTSALRLADGGRARARDWLIEAGCESLVREIGQLFLQREIRYPQSPREKYEALFISAGSGAAPFNLALGALWQCLSATIMTPTLIGTAPFDFAIVPEHDWPEGDDNIFVTLGAPNRIVKEELFMLGTELANEFPPLYENHWGVLFGGNDANYRVSPEVAGELIETILELASLREADLYVTTSRRTPHKTELLLAGVAECEERIRMLVSGSAGGPNPVPAMLGLCGTIFCTEDSISMVSEAATAGHRIVLLRVDRAGGLRAAIQSLCERLVDKGVLSPRKLWGVPRFDRTLQSFADRGLLVELDDFAAELRGGQVEAAPARREEENAPLDEPFNEARRAALWMCEAVAEELAELTGE